MVLWNVFSPSKIEENMIFSRFPVKLDSQLGQYESFILMGNFNVEPNDATMKNSYESIYNAPIWVLSLSLDVS